jgi:hypothetical protein
MATVYKLHKPLSRTNWVGFSNILHRYLSEFAGLAAVVAGAASATSNVTLYAKAVHVSRSRLAIVRDCKCCLFLVLYAYFMLK